MTPEEYLRARGWAHCNAFGRTELEYWTDPTNLGTHRETSAAIRTQVRRDQDCAEFVRAYGGALAAAEFDEVFGDND